MDTAYQGVEQSRGGRTPLRLSISGLHAREERLKVQAEPKDKLSLGGSSRIQPRAGRLEYGSIDQSANTKLGEQRLGGKSDLSFGASLSV